MKKLYRSKTEKRIAGVCGGLAQYLNVNVSIIRIAWALISIFTSGVPGTLVYIICAMIIPEEPDSFDTTGNYKN